MRQFLGAQQEQQEQQEQEVHVIDEPLEEVDIGNQAPFDLLDHVL